MPLPRTVSDAEQPMIDADVRQDRANSRSDNQVLHTRISELKDTVMALTIEVRELIAICKVCRTRVLGNGNEGVSERLSRLETTERISAWWITKMLTVCTILASIMGAAATIIAKAMGAG